MKSAQPEKAIRLAAMLVTTFTDKAAPLLAASGFEHLCQWDNVIIGLSPQVQELPVLQAQKLGQSMSEPGVLVYP